MLLTKISQRIVEFKRLFDNFISTYSQRINHLPCNKVLGYAPGNFFSFLQHHLLSLKNLLLPLFSSELQEISFLVN